MLHRDMSEETRIGYSKSEIIESDTIYNAAVQILTGYIASDKFNASNETAIIKKSVDLALELALQTDKSMTLEGHSKVNSL